MAGNQGGEAAVINLTGRRAADDPPSDVVKAARRGDHRAFTRLVDVYDDGLRALAFHLLGSREAMDDALQETYLNAYRGRRARPRCLRRLAQGRQHGTLDDAIDHGVADDYAARRLRSRAGGED